MRRRRHNLGWIRILTPLLAGIAGRVLGQETAAGEITEPQTNQSAVMWRFAGSAATQDDAALNDGGSVSVARFGVGGGFSMASGESWRLAAGLVYRRFNYDFSSGTDFLGTRPWDNMNQVRLAFGASVRVDEHWSVVAAPMVDYSGESGAMIDKAITGGGLLVVGWARDEDLRLGLGVMVSARQEEVPLPYPVLLFRWKFADQWVLRSGEFPFGPEGAAGIELDWGFTPGWQAAIIGQYQTWLFRLDDSGPVPNGFGSESVFPVSVQLTYSGLHCCRASVFAGVSLGGSLQVEYTNGHLASRQHYDPAPFVGLRAEATF